MCPAHVIANAALPRQGWASAAIRGNTAMHCYLFDARPTAHSGRRRKATVELRSQGAQIKGVIRCPEVGRPIHRRTKHIDNIRPQDVCVTRGKSLFPTNSAIYAGTQ